MARTIASKKAKNIALGIYAPTYKKKTIKNTNRNEGGVLIGANYEALQLAKLAYLETAEDKVLRYLYYWAGFILSGDVSSIITPTPYLIYY